MSYIFASLVIIPMPTEPTTKLIKGRTTKLGAPLSCAVRAYSRATGHLMSRGQSSPYGEYILLGCAGANYVVAVDPAETYNVAAQDNVK